MCDEDIKLLKKGITTLSLAVPLSNSLKCAVERDFTSISQREAYDILRYSLAACGKVPDLKEKTFSDVNWKSVDPEEKKILEKNKNYVFNTIKDITKENKVFIPKLKKSDLVVARCSIFFSSCLALVNYALSYQLEKCGLHFWPKTTQQSSRNVRMLLSNLEDKENNNFETQQKYLSEYIEKLESAITKLKDKKNETNLLLEDEISKGNYKGDLRDELDRDKMIAQRKYEVKELHTRNLQRIESIEHLNRLLNRLFKLLDMKDRVIINGEELARTIPFTVETFAENNSLSLRIDNQLHLSALLKTVHMTIPKEIKNKEIITELLTLKPPNTDMIGLQEKLKLQKEKLLDKIEKIHKKHGEDDKKEAICCLNDFLFTIPKVNFGIPSSLTTQRDPIFDEEKLNQWIGRADKNVRQKFTREAEEKDKEILIWMKRRNCKRKIIETQMAVKKDTKRLQKLNNKRKSISLINLSSISATSLKSLTNGEIDSPNASQTSHKKCSTPKENYERPFLNRSISPISVHSARDKSVRRIRNLSETVATNESILTENDIQGSLLNSCFSIDFNMAGPNSKTESKQDTFDFTATSIPNVSLDPTPPSFDLSI